MSEHIRMRSVLVVAEHAELRRELQASLRARLYDVITARTGQEALAMAASQQPDAVILDLGRPELGGTEVIVELRRWYLAPIIVLSSLSGPEYKIGALDAGADDYLTKPFVMGELLARLRAALRRDAGGSVLHDPPSRAIIGRWQVDLAAYRVTLADPSAADADAVVRLTRTEWAILRLLLQSPGQLVGSAQLLTSVWGPGFRQRTNYLRFHMARLRRKLEDDPSHPRYLLTEPGLGYRFQPRLRAAPGRPAVAGSSAG